MQTLFEAAKRFVIVYASNTNDNSYKHGEHVRHRNVTDWVAANAKDWKLRDTVRNKHPYTEDNPNTSFADFFIFERKLNR